MSELSPVPEECEVDPDLMRRVAWGMIAGKSKAEIAAAEDLTAEECEIVCTAPGMFSIVSVWANFLERRREAGRRHARKLTGWCVDHVFQHAPDRLNRNEVWRLDRLSSVMLHYGFAIVLGWMLGFLDGVMSVPGAKRRDLGDFKQNLVDLLCWTIEVTFREKMLEQYSVDLLIAKDGAFQAAIAGREYFEFGIGGDLAAAPSGTASGAAAESPTVARKRPRTSRPASSRPVASPASRSASRPEREPLPLRASAGRTGIRRRPTSSLRRHARSVPIRPPPRREAMRWRDGRCRPPPLRRSLPIERVA